MKGTLFIGLALIIVPIVAVMYVTAPSSIVFWRALSIIGGIASVLAGSVLVSGYLADRGG